MIVAQCSFVYAEIAGQIASFDSKAAHTASVLQTYKQVKAKYINK